MILTLGAAPNYREKTQVKAAGKLVPGGKESVIEIHDEGEKPGAQNQEKEGKELRKTQQRTQHQIDQKNRQIYPHQMPLHCPPGVILVARERLCKCKIPRPKY